MLGQHSLYISELGVGALGPFNHLRWNIGLISPLEVAEVAAWCRPRRPGRNRWPRGSPLAQGTR